MIAGKIDDLGAVAGARKQALEHFGVLVRPELVLTDPHLREHLVRARAHGDRQPLPAGARLDLVYDLTLTKAPQATPPGISGTIAGSIELTPAHVDALKAGKFYIQINSEGAPNGHLLGWLLK